MRLSTIFTIGFTLCSLLLSGQYFRNTYNITSTSGTSAYTILPIDDESFVKLESNNGANSKSITRISTIDGDGKELWSKTKNYMYAYNRSLVVRNDTIFYSGNSDSNQQYYWYFGMMKTNGDSIVEYKFLAVNASSGAANNYGITLIDGSNAILWGEGLESRASNPNNNLISSAFLRVKFDGSLQNQMLWFDLGKDVSRKMSEVRLDINDNLVFGYRHGNGTNHRNYIIKLKPNNEFEVIGSIASTDQELQPYIAIDSKNNYYTQALILDTISSSGLTVLNLYLIKMDKVGNLLWKSKILANYPLLNGKPTIFSPFVFKIFCTSSDQILLGGTCRVIDSLVVPFTGKKQIFSNAVSFFARFDQDGNPLWEHAVVPQLLPDGYIQQNYIFDIIEHSDKSILIAGSIFRTRNNPRFRLDSWVMRLSPDGCLSTACDHLEKYWHFPKVITSSDDQAIVHTTVFPNPGSDYINIKIDESWALPVSYELISTCGTISLYGKSTVTRDLELETSSLSAGLYMIRLSSTDGRIAFAKWIKL